jgi:hypothetical protein
VGSAGKRIDGPAPLTFNMGRFLALANNSRAYYPNMQQIFLGVSIGRAARGVRPTSTEKEVDEYLSNPKFYPAGLLMKHRMVMVTLLKMYPCFARTLLHLTALQENLIFLLISAILLTPPILTCQRLQHRRALNF